MPVESLILRRCYPVPVAIHPAMLRLRAGMEGTPDIIHAPDAATLFVDDYKFTDLRRHVGEMAPSTLYEGSKITGSRLLKAEAGLGAVAIMTSDTTKAAARDLDLERFLSESGQRLAADIFAGSQAIMHNADVIAVCGEDCGVPFQQTQWVRVLQGRTGAPAEVYPFRWETHLGRFRPRKSEPLRAIDPERGGRGGRGDAPRGGGRSWARRLRGGIGDRQ